MADLRFGFATHFQQGLTNWPLSLMPLIAATGAGYIRDDLTVGEWEPTPGTYAVSASDKVWCDSAHANGLKVVGLLNKDNTYVSGGFSTDPYDPTLMANRAAFIAQSGLVDVIEVCNEPNNDYQTVEGSTWETKLPILTTAVLNAVNAVSSTVQVIGLGAQGQQILNMVPNTTVDGVVYHPYDTGTGSPPKPRPSTCFENPPTDFYVPWIHDIQAVTSLPLWETEWGAQTQTGFTEDNQADYLIRRLLMSIGLGVQHTFIYDFKDSPGADTFGVYAVGIIAKAAVGAITRLIGALTGVAGDPTTTATFVSVASGDTTDATAYIYRGSKKTVVASWFENFSPSDPLAPAASTCSIRFTVTSAWTVAASSVLDPVAGTSVPLSTYTTSLSGNTLTVSGFPISDHPLLIILMPTNWFIKPGGTGNGSTWTAAWSATSISWASVAAGDIVWVAGGAYGALITPGKSGTSGNPITLRKVLPSDTVTSVAGYQTSFGTSVATFSSGTTVNNVSWFVYDGQVGSKIGPVPYGFTVTGGLSNANPMTLDNVTFKFMEFIGPYNTNNSSGFNDGVSFAPSSGGITNILFNNCAVRGFAENLRGSLWSNVTWEYCYLADCYDDLAEHVDMIYSYPSSNLTFRYNFFNNCPLDGLFHEFNGHTNNFYYGNVFYNCSLHQICYKNQQNDVPYVYGPGIYIYNNTFYNPSLDGFIGDGGGGGTMNAFFATWTGGTGTVQVRNNLFFGCDNQFAGSNSSYAPCVSTNNASNSSLEPREVNSFVYALTPANIFVSIPTRVQSGNPPAVAGTLPNATDFTLKSTAVSTFQRGFSIAPVSGHTFDTDMNGNRQSGTWIVGALLPSSGTTTITLTGLTGQISVSGISSLTSSAGSPIFIQATNPVVPSGTATTKTAVYASAQSAGNCNIVVVTFGDASGTITETISSVRDTANINSYTLAVPFQSFVPTSGGGAIGQAIYIAPSIVFSTAGNIVTVTLSAAASFFAVSLVEYSGVKTVSPIDVTRSATGTGTAASSGAAITNGTLDLVFGAVSAWDGVSTVGSGFTGRASGYVTLTEDQNLAPGSYSATSTAPSSSGWVAQMLALLSAPSNSVSLSGLNGHISVSGVERTTLRPMSGLTGQVSVSGVLTLGSNAPTFVQGNSSSVLNSASGNCSMASAQTAGNVNLLVVSTSSTSPIGISGAVTDTAGHTYTLMNGPTTVGSNPVLTQWIYMSNI